MSAQHLDEASPDQTTIGPKKLRHYQWQPLIMAAPIPDKLKLSYIALRNYDTDAKGCFVRQSKVAADYKIKPRTLRRHLALLREHGYFTSTQHRGPNHYYFTDAIGTDLLLRELPPIKPKKREKRVYSANSSGGLVRNGLANPATRSGGLANSANSSGGLSEVAVEVQDKNIYCLGDTRPATSAQHTAALSEHKDSTEGGNGHDQDPVKADTNEPAPEPFTAEQKQELMDIMRQGGGAKLHTDERALENLTETLLGQYGYAKAKEVVAGTRTDWNKKKSGRTIPARKETEYGEPGRVQL